MYEKVLMFAAVAAYGVFLLAMWGKLTWEERRPSDPSRPKSPRDPQPRPESPSGHPDDWPDEHWVQFAEAHR